MNWLRRRLPYLISLLSGTGLLAAARLAVAHKDGNFFVWSVIAGSVSALVAIGGILIFWGGRPLRSLRLALPAVFLTVSAFLYLLIIETPWGRFGLTALVMFLTAVFFESLRRSLPAGSDRPGPASLIYLSLVLDAVSLFFLLAFIFGLATFYNISLSAASAGIGLVTAFMAHEMLWRAGFATRDQAALVAASGFIGAEVFAGLYLLPTSYLVNAAVAVVLLTAALHVVKQVLSGAGELKYFRKELAAALLLAVLLLTTARWA